MGRSKPKREPVPIERPLLTELIYECQRIAGKPLSVASWNEIFYNLSIQPEAPKCLTELRWTMLDGLLQSDDLMYMLSFCQALSKVPSSLS